MDIQHNPITKIHKVEEHYSLKDNVPVKYVCTTALDENSSMRLYDVFYRSSPHPEFGNRYFGISHLTDGDMLITNADQTEGFDFGMIHESSTDKWLYSSHRHDYQTTSDGKVIDGGRAYVRGNGYEMFKVKDGQFVRQSN